jgi:hypothetical protein
MGSDVGFVSGAGVLHAAAMPIDRTNIKIILRELHRLRSSGNMNSKDEFNFSDMSSSLGTLIGIQIGSANARIEKGK